MTPPKGNGSKTAMAVKIAKLETICEFTKDAIEKLDKGQTTILQEVVKIGKQVEVNKTRIALWGALGGLLGGGIVTLVVSLIVRSMRS